MNPSTKPSSSKLHRISTEALIVVVLRNNGEERLLLSSSPDLIPPLEFEIVAKSSFMTPAPVRNVILG